VQNGQK